MSNFNPCPRVNPESWDDDNQVHINQQENHMIQPVSQTSLIFCVFAKSTVTSGQIQPYPWDSCMVNVDKHSSSMEHLGFKNILKKLRKLDTEISSKWLNVSRVEARQPRWVKSLRVQEGWPFDRLGVPMGLMHPRKDSWVQKRWSL